jgi:hypothetical protein
MYRPAQLWMLLEVLFRAFPFRLIADRILEPAPVFLCSAGDLLDRALCLSANVSGQIADGVLSLALNLLYLTSHNIFVSHVIVASPEQL